MAISTDAFETSAEIGGSKRWAVALVRNRPVRHAVGQALERAPASIHQRIRAAAPRNRQPTGRSQMADTTIKKVEAKSSPVGEMGQKYLASGKRVSLRLWEAEPRGETMRPTRREYETVGYVIDGRAELHLEGQLIKLAPGDSWLVPQDAEHHYRILEPFTAVEATAPPAQVHGRDEG
jgi:quercetin dioxygenase-like cupin family protein